MQFDLAGFLTTGVAVLVMLGILSSLIIVHEFGHWSVARFFGFQTPIFGFGLPFGPTWSLGKKWDTEFKIHACLVGGYVAIPELGDESNATQEHFGVQLKPFKKFPVWQRMLVAFAGVNNNIIFAWLVMFIMLMTLGVPKQDVVVHNLPAANPIAKQAGVQQGDRIVAIDRKKMAGVDDVIQYLGKHKKETVVLHIFRPDPVEPATKSDAGKEKDSAATSSATDTPKETSTDTSTAATPGTASDTGIGTSTAKQSEEEEEDDFTKDTASIPGKNVDITVTTNADGKVGMALVGKGKMTYQKLDGSPLDIAVMSAQKLWGLTTSMLDAMGMMVQGIFSGGGGGQTATGQPAPKMGIDDLHGVLAVVKIGADIAQQDWTQLFMFTIMISMDLAIINLVPWPALDGGHLAFMLVELLTGRPMNERAQNALVKWGFVSLLVLMAVIMVNDVRALFTGQLDVKVKSGKKHTQEKKEQDRKAPEDPQKAPTVDNNALPEGPAGTPTPAPAHP
ncbi:MAG: RIP metalloprotease RseP [Candidatus Obscuribacterales bacterium]|nr:RIP metalloprotease RseP [Candidatus Obscuribacterales bacterium]